MFKKKLTKNILAGLLAMLLIFGMVADSLPAPASAAKSSAQIQQEINQMKEQLKNNKAEVARLESQLSKNMDQMEDIVANKNLIDQQIFLLHDQVQNLNKQIAVYNTLIADKQAELDKATANWKALSDKYKERIRAMEEDGKLSYWSVLFKANSFADLLDRLNMIEEIAAADRRRLKEMSEVAEEVANAQAALESEKVALEDVRKSLEEKQAVLAEKRAEADQLLVELNAKGQEFDAMMDDAESEAEDLIAQIAKKEKEYNEAKEKEQQASNPNYGSSTPPAHVVNGITWITPCKYSRVSSAYGWRIHPVYKTWKFHSGIDLAASSGTPIYATRSGTVTTAQYHYSAGNYVTINHGDGFSTSYLHMTHDTVSVGDYVVAGEIIGYVGSTGVSTGPHLHFTMYWNGETINPADYIKFN